MSIGTRLQKGHLKKSSTKWRTQIAEKILGLKENGNI